MTTKQKTQMYDRINQHGRNLISLFGLPTDTDPVKLAKQLRRIEARAQRIAENYCNIANYGDLVDGEIAKIGKSIARVIGADNADRVWVNLDPRGYALKINLTKGETLYSDLGSNGIIAPDLSSDY